MLNFDADKTFKGKFILTFPIVKTPTEVDAELIFSPGKFVLLRFKTDFNIEKEPFYAQGHIVFTSKEGSFLLYNFIKDDDWLWGFVFQYALRINKVLFSCDRNYNWDMLVINKISLHTENLNEWLFRRMPTEYQEKLEAIKNYKSQIDFDIKTKENKLVHIFDEFKYREKENTHKLEIKTFISLESKDTPFDEKDIYECCKKIELLLIILSGVRQNKVTMKVNNDLFFYMPNYQEPNKISQSYFIFRLNVLKEEGVLGAIFDNFYQKIEDIETAFPNFWGLMNSSSTSYWEDNYFRLFSMLDSITSKKKLETEIPFSEHQKKEICLKMKEFIITFYNKILENEKSEEKRKEYDQILGNICNKLDNRLTYRQKVRKLLRRCLTEDAIKIIDISEENLGHIVDMRNKLAHADPLTEDLKRYRHVIFHKVLLLIFYLIWRDLGINDKTIFYSLAKSFHFVKYFANEKELDIYNGIPLFNFSEAEVKNLQKIPYGYSLEDRKPVYSKIILEKIGEKYSVNIEKNIKYREKIAQAYSLTSEMITALVKEIYPEAVKIKFLPNIWVDDCNSFSKDISNVFIVEI